MSNNIKMTLIDQFNYLALYNEDLFKNFKRPEGMSDEDFSTLKDNILLTANEFECFYGDPYFTQFAVGTWSRKHFWTFSKWCKALTLEYNPLENYRRTEHWTDAHSGQESTQDTGKETTANAETSNETGNNTNTNVVAETTANNTASSSSDNTDTTTENKVSAFNSSSYSPESETTGNTANVMHAESEAEGSRDVTTTDNGNTSLTGSKSFTGDIDTTRTGSKSESSDNEHEGLVYGNIGVTTSQQMLQSELELARFNLIQNISDMFVDEFCIKVY